MLVIVSRLNRITVILKVCSLILLYCNNVIGYVQLLVDQVAVLETMAPQDFIEFR